MVNPPEKRLPDEQIYVRHRPIMNSRNLMTSYLPFIVKLCLIKTIFYICLDNCFFLAFNVIIIFSGLIIILHYCGMHLTQLTAIYCGFSDGPREGMLSKG